mmetsp:Transcript_10599/g.44180  ORF Transcript_10599/g.44180 Transcript_10599/m.44180 type:complete len:101 (-) Transcript_10599:609-911(-)|eukprot:CAMPEP_0113963444 /NCGR_PEP_ID=MMETSP0011_2-20120614/6515_1 /TAXON_ID=101924 /ORGANISM="Rhodosorus marinus" /LENGTH=100 /DNA_ID=CAMNT_0000975491 /DNA_START=110 /DNA_END=412 /DNA_ORIENTATION=- /assembly_acc=CAM_ASM_000156
MGSTASKDDEPAMSQRQPMVSQKQRKVCYEHRDRYYECFNTQTGDGSADQCKELRRQYEEACLRSWVKYFDDMHKNEKSAAAQKRMMQTVQPSKRFAAEE